MSKNISDALSIFQRFNQILGCWIICLSTVAALVLTVGSIAGLLPWLSLPVAFGNTSFPQAGMGIQIALAALLVTLCSFLPSSARVMAL